jgi:SAM-dependent methyltransferase
VVLHRSLEATDPAWHDPTPLTSNVSYLNREAFVESVLCVVMDYSFAVTDFRVYHIASIPALLRSRPTTGVPRSDATRGQIARSAARVRIGIIVCAKWRSWVDEPQIRFDDGESYERHMGDWSQRVGKAFLDWLAAPSGLKWIDVRCGNGAFTEILVERCAPAEVRGIDPSEAQLAFARKRPAARLAKFDSGDAMALPFSSHSFDAAIMALVIFFVPDPGKDGAEMVRVVRPGGIVAGYAWDILGGGFTLEPLRIELRSMGFKPVDPPSVEASRMKVMQDLWTKTGLAAIETRQITVQLRAFRGILVDHFVGRTQPRLARRPCRRCAATGVKPISGKLLRRQRQREQCRQKRPPRGPALAAKERSEDLLIIERVEDVHGALSSMLTSRA